MMRESTYLSEYDLAVTRFTANCLWNHIQTVCTFDAVNLRYRIRVFRGGTSYIIRTSIVNIPPVLMVNLVSEVVRQLFRIDRSDWR